MTNTIENYQKLLRFVDKLSRDDLDIVSPAVKQLAARLVNEVCELEIIPESEYYGNPLLAIQSVNADCSDIAYVTDIEGFTSKHNYADAAMFVDNYTGETHITVSNNGAWRNLVREDYVPDKAIQLQVWLYHVWQGAKPVVPTSVYSMLALYNEFMDGAKYHEIVNVIQNSDHAMYLRQDKPELFED